MGDRNIQTVTVTSQHPSHAPANMGQFQQPLNEGQGNRTNRVCPRPEYSNNRDPCTAQPRPELPAGWKEGQDPSGKYYYWAVADPGGSRTWERPTAPWGGQEAPMREM